MIMQGVQKISWPKIKIKYKIKLIVFAEFVYFYSILFLVRIGSAATATGSFLLGTAGVHQIIMKFSQHHRKMHQN